MRHDFYDNNVDPIRAERAKAVISLLSEFAAESVKSAEEALQEMDPNAAKEIEQQLGETKPARDLGDEILDLIISARNGESLPATTIIEVSASGGIGDEVLRLYLENRSAGVRE